MTGASWQALAVIDKEFFCCKRKSINRHLFASGQTSARRCLILKGGYRK
jgi:hypothetical protein